MQTIWYYKSIEGTVTIKVALIVAGFIVLQLGWGIVLGKWIAAGHRVIDVSD